MNKKLLFILSFIVLNIFVFNDECYAANITSIKVGYNMQDIHPYKGDVKKTIDNYNKKYGTKYSLNLDNQGHFYFPLQGFGNVQLRKGYTSCTYEDKTTGACSYDKELENPLKVTTVGFYDGSKYALFITVDIVSMKDYWINQIRDEIYKNVKTINSNNSLISISATHTHSAPSFSFLTDSNKQKYPDLWWNTYFYKLYFYEQVIKSVNGALKNMYDASISTSAVDVIDSNNKKLNFVRHYKTDSTYKNGDTVYTGDNHGTYAWNGSQYVGPKYKDHASESDSKMQLIKIKYNNDVKNKNKVKDILMINWQAHPGVVGGSLGKVISADFVGYMRKYLSNKNFDYNVAYYTGAAGNLNVRSNMPVSSNEAMINEVYFANQSYNAYSTKQKVEASRAIGNKLAEYVIKGSKNKFSDVSLDKIVYTKETFRINYKNKVANDSIIYNNAQYVYQIYNSNKDVLKQMIEGTYVWSQKIDFNKINYDKDGVELAKIIKSVIGRAIPSNAIVIDGPGKNTPSGYTCTITDKFTLSHLYSLLTIIGVDLDNLKTKESERLYSGYDAVKVISLNGVSNDKMYENVELDAISIGNLSLATAPFELFDNNGKNIKSNSSSLMTFILGYTNGYHGYLPSSSAYDYGCYEVDNSYFKKGSAESVQNKLVAMIKENNNKKEKNNSKNGDINGDGKITAIDYIMIKKHILKTSILTANETKTGDMNGDGKITSSDYIAIKKIIMSDSK